MDMSGIVRTESCEEMPPLEPLGDPESGDAHPLHDLPSISASPPLMAPSPKRISDHDIVCFVTAPLRLSLILENKGNVARDHLASERTYLAYVRTSLATASTGVALVQLFTLAPQRSNGINLAAFAKPLGATIILFGLLILVFGTVRYFATQYALVRGQFPVARNSIAGMAFFLGALTGIVFGIVVAGTRG